MIADPELLLTRQVLFYQSALVCLAARGADRICVETNGADARPIPLAVRESRSKVGLDVAIEALKECRQQKKASIHELASAAKVCRVANVMRPYLESL